MNTTQRPQSRPQYPNAAHFASSAGPRPAYPYAPVAQPPYIAAPKQPWWERDGVVAKIFAAAGVLVTLIGVVMLLVIAARAGLLRPELRVAGGALLSAGLLGGSVLLERRTGGRVGAVALAATGTAGLYLCVVAATNFYGWIPSVAGLAMAAIIAVAAVALAMRWNSQSLAVLMTASVGVLAPVLTQGLTIPLIAFLVLLQAAGCVPEFTKNWPAIAAARTLPVAFATTVAVVTDRSATSSQIAAYLVATIALTSALAASRNTHEGVTGAIYALASIPMIIAVTALTGPVAAIAGAAIASMTLTSIVLARPVGIGTTAAATLVTAVSLLSATVTITHGEWLPAILLGIGLVLMASVYQVKNYFIAATSLIFVGVGALAEIAVAGSNSNAHWTWATFVGGVLMTANIVLGLIIGVRRFHADRDSAVVLGALGLLVSIGLSLMSFFVAAFGPEGAAYGHLAMTITWMLIAVTLLAMSLRTDTGAATLVITGMAVAALALGKLFLHDLSNLSGIVRAGAFIVVGLVLLAAGAGYAQAFAKRATRRRAAASQQQVQQPMQMR